MSAGLTVNRKLIREYFECLKKRRTTTESFAKQVISDLLAHWKEGRPPKEGIWAYIIIGGLLFSLVVNPFLSLVLIIVTFYVAQLQKSPNIMPPIDDKQIDRWLLEDKLKLFKKAPSELDVIIVSKSEDTPELLNVVMNQDYPIELSSGFTLHDKTDEERKFWGILIRDRDYFIEKGLDGKTRYSIHVFLNIFLCRNFLTYYKCYWNFLRGEEILIETGEYLYDTIVSVNTEELLLATLGNGEGEKLIMKKKVLRIGTTDGKEIVFPALSDIRVSYESSYENDSLTVKDAAHIIREMLRERRIDMQIVKPFDADD